jgi:hypothetical protein
MSSRQQNLGCRAQFHRSFFLTHYIALQPERGNPLRKKKEGNMKTFIAIILTTTALSASPAVTSHEVSTLETEPSQRKRALVSLVSAVREAAPRQVVVQHYVPESSQLRTYDIRSVETDACGNTTYKAILNDGRLRIPEHHYEAKLIDYTDRICFIHRPFQWELTLIFRDDLKGTSEEIKYFGIPTKKPSDADAVDSPGTVEVKFRTDKGRNTAAYLASYTATFQCRSQGGSLGDRISFDYDEKTGDTRAVYSCIGSNESRESVIEDSSPDQTVLVDGNDLVCRPHIGGSNTILLHANYLKVPGLKHNPSFSALVGEEGCDVMKLLRGQLHRVPVNIESNSYQVTGCERGGFAGCWKQGCFEFTSEKATLTFSHGLKLQSQTTSPIRTLLYSGECKK